MIEQIIKADASRPFRIARKNAEEAGAQWSEKTRTWTLIRPEAVPAAQLKSRGLLEVSRRVLA